MVSISVLEKRKPGTWWLMPVILATQEAAIRRIIVGRPAQANSSVRPYLKKTLHKRGLLE
jgi:hypothetical protein